MHEGDVPSTEEALAVVLEKMEKETGHGDSNLVSPEDFTDTLGLNEKTKTFGTLLQQGSDKLSFPRDRPGLGSGGGKTEGKGTVREATNTGKEDSFQRQSEGKISSGSEERVFHANPYISNVPAGRPVTLR